MQFTNRNGVTKITLLQAEERQLRNAAYMIRSAGRMLETAPGIPDLEAAAVALLWLVQEGSRGKNKAKLDAQDAMEPEVPIVTKPFLTEEQKQAMGPVLSEERGALKS